MPTAVPENPGALELTVTKSVVPIKSWVWEGVKNWCGSPAASALVQSGPVKGYSGKGHFCSELTQRRQENLIDFWIVFKTHCQALGTLLSR